MILMTKLILGLELRFIWFTLNISFQSIVDRTSAKDPSSLASNVEEPLNDGWDEGLPDIVHRVTVKDAEPEVEWQKGEKSGNITGAIPDPVNQEFSDTWEAIHVKVFAKAIWVKLLASSIAIIVPVATPFSIVAQATDESLSEEWIPWHRN